MQNQIPRNITRSGWVGYQHHLRSLDSREEAGLPPHPANDLITCPQCDGEGEADIVWVAEDDYTCNTCPRCSGACEIQDGHVDPLVKLQTARRRRRSYVNKNARTEYELARLVAMRPQCGLSQADMLAMSTRCVTRSQELVARMAA